ncbi:DUF1146 family protein [Heyndrickxia sp. NPDC080065]|uniref:DUF1146 family protein n=1 Tax=Heyndrickxia sp. NPDC080065 TaxID=3390568 RepID=UPI003CFEE3BA
MTSGFGQQALTSIISHLFFICLTFWALGALNFEKLLKPNRVLQARLLYIILTIAIGSIISNFFLDYLLWSRQLPLIFQFVINL